MRIELEAKLGYAIPDELDDLFNQDTNQYADLTFFITHPDGYKDEDRICCFSTYQTFWQDNEYRNFLEDFQEQFELDNTYVQSEHLYIIGETYCGSVCMALNGIHKGKIYIADNGDFGITLLANTLQDFLNSLYALPQK